MQRLKARVPSRPQAAERAQVSLTELFGLTRAASAALDGYPVPTRLSPSATGSGRRRAGGVPAPRPAT